MTRPYIKPHEESATVATRLQDGGAHFELFYRTPAGVQTESFTASKEEWDTMVDGYRTRKVGENDSLCMMRKVGHLELTYYDHVLMRLDHTEAEDMFAVLGEIPPTSRIDLLFEE